MRLPKRFYNLISLIGAGLALVTFGTIAIFVGVDLFGSPSNAYFGIFTYMVLPVFLVLGLLLIPLGVWKEIRRERRHGASRRSLVIDFHDPRQRLAFMLFTVGTMLFIAASAAGTYQAFHYSESVEFCGEVCHEVMHPEYIAYQESPHARVACAECHIGSGADWFVKAKISGSYQVYSVLFNKYSRPIETPVHNLRPARETCERCHWPEKFTGDVTREKTYFPLDTSQARPWTLVMNVHIGGGRSELGATQGIHWHMNTRNVVRYVATDAKRQVIPWVEARGRDGKLRVYRSTDQTLAEKDRAKYETRTMDCIDCHNRPSHNYHPPFHTLNASMGAGSIPADLPNIRAIASAALTASYRSTEQARTAIPAAIRDAYAHDAPQVLHARARDVDRAIGEVRRIYERSFFPAMNVDWRHYPDNRGHMYNDGCFRCHDNRHVADDGTVLSNDCRLCHTIVAQGPTGEVLQSNLAGLEFRHPADVGDSWKTSNCTDCHMGD